ncbi:BCCT family transporter [Clostridium sp.]|uniref:glycine betaine uptake BCCT transporter n=1 Tax=Clostridium sp. TaxID=1506 RepID=UPI001A3D270C|nr:BCCT family transporter [Clostridium sp.]MBK5241389.1 BCCT family transporter [Clostridium sp.]
MKKGTNVIDKKGKGQDVYFISLALTFIIVIWAIVAKDNFTNVSNGLLKFLTENFGWAYLVSMVIFVGFSLTLAFSKYGKIKLGANDSKPDYSNASWFAMLFGAGMGIGLVFWGVSEPLSHFIAPPNGITPGTEAAANFAMKASFMHWGFHPWANYAIIGLALAYFQYRRNKPALISSIFEPLIGEKGVKGPLGKTIDVLAIFATVAGIATSLGLGTMQINSGLNYLFQIPETHTVQILIILIIAICYIWTAVSGIDKGIKIISDVNLYLAGALIVLAFLVGPTLKMINTLTGGMGLYLNDILKDSLAISAFGDNSWLNGWRIFYWAWWIAWAPFVGSFIARISKGRTIKEFVLGVVVAPSVASFIWFSVFGAAGINLGITGAMSMDSLKQIVASPETALFIIMGHYKFGTILSLIATVLLVTFFITSANSGTFVLGMFSSGGDLNPSNSKKIIWGVVLALLAGALLLSGGLQSLQTISVAAAFPFIFVMLFACVSLWKALKSEDISS